MEYLLNNYNIITPLLIIFLLFPIITGAFIKISRESTWISLVSILRVFEFMLSIITAFFITKKLFFESHIPIFIDFKKLILNNIQGTINQEPLLYLIITPVVFVIIHLLLRFILLKVETRLFDKLASILFLKLDQLWQPLKIILKTFFQLPKAIINTLFLSLLLTVYSMYSPSALISDQLDQSAVYKLINQYTIEPFINSSYVQKIPVLFNHSIVHVNQSQLPNELLNNNSLPTKLRNGTKIIWYFNGVTLDDAIKSNEQIDDFAVNLIKAETNNRKKARIIYKWIASNIKYDFEKAERVSQEVGDSSSGAISAFNTRKGICFDSSALYVAMCKAIGLKVRLIVGLGFNGISWGEHSWNQVYIPEEDKWVNVDTTFAIGGNYFDKANFQKDHNAGQIAGEW